MGMFAGCYSACHDGKVIGVMITASHNLEQDNGIKIVDIDGGMLSQVMEPLAESLANVTEMKDFTDIINDIYKKFKKSSKIGIGGGVVMVGRDTRPHSEGLQKCVEDGIRAIGGSILDLGVVTTPQLHFTRYRS